VAVPLHGTRFVDGLNERLLVAQVAFAARALRLRRPLLWSYLPQPLSFRRRLGSPRALYYRTDDYLSFPHVPVPTLAAAERAPVVEADLCVGAARRYLDEALAPSRNAIFVPNAVDVDHYADVAPPSPANPRPRLLM